MIWLWTDWRFKCFVGQMIWVRNDFGCQLIRDTNDLAVNWFEIRMTSESDDWRAAGLRLK